MLNHTGPEPIRLYNWYIWYMVHKLGELRGLQVG